MKLRLKYSIYIKPDKNGDYPDAIAKRLIAAGIAEPLETASVEISEKRNIKPNCKK